ncbi:MFS transporter [Streptomyces sp. NRAIS4]
MSGLAEQPALPSGPRFTVFLLGQIFSLLGDGLAFLAIPLLVIHQTSNPFAAALAAAPRMIGYLLMGMLAGAIVDRCNPRVIMLVTDLVRFCTFLLLAVLTSLQHVSVLLILLLAFAVSGAGVFFDTALAVAVKGLAGGKRLTRANSLLEACNQAALIVGPGIFGLVTAAVGLHTALFVNAGTYLFSLATVYATGRGMPIGTALSGVADPLRHLGREIREGLRYLGRARLILLLTCSQTSANLFLAVQTLTPFYLRETLKMDTATVGLVVGAGGFGGVAGAALASKLAIPTRQLLLVAPSMICCGCAIASIGLVSKPITLGSMNFMVSASLVLVVVVIRNLRQQLVPSNLLGRVTATARMTALASAPVGAMLAGFFTGLNHGNPEPVYIGAGALVISSTVAMWLGGLRKYSRSMQNA